MLNIAITGEAMTSCAAHGADAAAEAHPPSLSEAATLIFQRRLRHRRNSVAFVKGTREYEVYQKALAMHLARPCLEPDPEALPPIRKRTWEKSIQAWRGVLQAIDARWGDLVRFAESGGAVDGAAGGGGQ